jgi:copper resistance protein B
MKIRLPILFLAIAVLSFGLAVNASSAAAQDMPHNMPMPSPTPTPKATPKPAPTATPTPSPKPTATPMSMPTDMPSPAPTVTPSPSPSPHNMPAMDMPMPQPTPTPKPSPKPSTGGETQTFGNLSPEKELPEPVADNERFGSTLFDVLEFRPGRNGGDGDFRWDIEGWYGTDKNRFFYKSEGERNTAFKAEYDIDLQLLYGRMIHPYFDFQVGVRFETQTFRGANVTRPQAVVGLEGLLPYFIELESGIFIDPKGNVSGRASLTKDFLFTNRWIVQARFETNAAVQRVERFTTGRGLNNIEAGLRLRYEFSRRFAPYVGVTFDRSFFGTADLVRQEGGDPKQVRFAMGVRLLF